MLVLSKCLGRHLGIKPVDDLDSKSLFRRTIESVGPDRIIFGTDSSYFPRGLSLDYLGEQLKVCRLLGLEETSIQKIFEKNAAKLLNRDT